MNATLDAAENVLSDPSIEPYVFPTAIQPQNQDIARLTTLYKKKKESFGKRPLENNQDIYPDALADANLLMQWAFAISYWTLCEAKTVESLCNPQSYAGKTYFTFPMLYHNLRALANNTLNMQNFYEPGTIRNKWNQLYNEFCRQVELRYEMKKLHDAVQSDLFVAFVQGDHIPNEAFKSQYDFFLDSL